MSRFSASDAALEGFRVIREHPRLIAGWAVFNLLALVAMVVLTVIVLLTVGLAAGGGASAAAAQVSGAVGGVVGALGAFLIQAMVVAALYRVLLRPDEPGFLYLRLGPDELRILGVWLILIVAAVPIVGLAVLGVSAAAQAGFGAAVLVGLALGVGVLLLAQRFVLATVISFAERRIRVIEAWRLTRGHTWSLLGMNLLAGCLAALVAIVAWILLFVTMWALSGFHEFGLATLSDPESLKSQPGRYLFQLAAQLMFAPVISVITQAPLVAAYKALAAPAAGEP
jgi:hypothetical protein